MVEAICRRQMFIAGGAEQSVSHHCQLLLTRRLLQRGRSTTAGPESSKEKEQPSVQSKSESAYKIFVEETATVQYLKLMGGKVPSYYIRYV